MKKHLLTIFFLALLVRTAYILVVPPRPATMDDFSQWNLHALHYLHGGSLCVEPEGSDLIRPPLYPLFLSANYFFFGETNYNAAKFFQAILDSLTCVGIYAIAFLLFGQNVALGTGLCAALYPPFIVYTEILQSEIPFTFIVILFMLSLLLANRHSSWALYLLSGLVLGLSNLCRGTLLYFPLFIMALPFIFKEMRKDILKYAALAAMSFLVLSPWTWRNYKVYNAFISIRPRSSELLWFGTMPLNVQKEYGKSKEFLELKIPADLKEQEIFFKNMAIQNIKSNPVSYVKLITKKFVYFWVKPVGHELISQKSRPLGWMALFFHISLLIFSAGGIILTRSHWKTLFPIYLLMAYFALIHTLLMPMPRFRLPIEPFIILFASAGIGELLKKRIPNGQK